MTPYKNFLDEDLLFWDCEKGHGSDDRIVGASRNGEEIHLFYRDQRHTPFTYHGKVVMVRCDRFIDRPSGFVFNVLAIAPHFASADSMQLAEDPADYAMISGAGIHSIDRAVVAKKPRHRATVVSGQPDATLAGILCRDESSRNAGSAF